MARKTYIIDSISGGLSKTFYDSKSSNTYAASLGIDPDMATGRGGSAILKDIKTSGAIAPVTYAKFSGANVNASVIKIITQPKLDKIYAILTNGRIISYDNVFASETLVGTITGGNANGAEYYNNYIYIFGTGSTLAYNTQTANFTVGQVLTGSTSGATGIIKADVDSGATGTLTLGSIQGIFQNAETITDPLGGSAKANGVVTGTGDISRYGPLDGSPTLINGFWTNLGLTALGNQTYPTIKAQEIRKHWAHVHGDNALYFCDYINGQGFLSKIITKKGNNELSNNVEGGANNGSAYQVLLLPFGALPTCVESYGTDLVVTAMAAGTSTVFNQGPAQMFFWDTFSDTFYNTVPLPDPIVTSVFNSSSRLYVFSGNLAQGFRMSEYAGGRTVNSIALFEEGAAPFQGSVDSFGDRLSFGGFISFPTTAACAFSYRSKEPSASPALHNTVRTTSAGNSPFVTALKYATQLSNQNPRVIIAWTDDSGSGIDKLSADNSNSIFVSDLFVPGKRFVIEEVFIPLAYAVDSATLIQVAIFTDGGDGSFSLPNINNTNFSGRYNILWKNPKINGTQEISGNNDFYVRILWNGSKDTPVIFPVQIKVNIYDDELA